MKKSVDVLEKDYNVKDLIDEVGNCHQTSREKKKKLMSSFFKTKSTSSPNMKDYIAQHNSQREQLQQQQQAQQQQQQQNCLIQNNQIQNQQNQNICLNSSINNNMNINNSGIANCNGNVNNHSVTVKVGNTSSFLKKSINMAQPLSSSTVINSLVDNDSTSTSNSSTPRSTVSEDNDDDYSTTNQLSATDEASCTPLSSDPDSEPEELLTRRTRRANKQLKSLSNAFEQKQQQKSQQQKDEQEKISQLQDINKSEQQHSDILKENGTNTSTTRTSTSSTSSDLSTISSGVCSSTMNSNASSNKNTNTINNNNNNNENNNISSNDNNNNTNTNNNNNNNPNHLNSSTSSTNSYKSTNFIITSKPSNDKSWELPSTLTIEKCKELASKDNEFILSNLSSIQKQLQQLAQPSSPSSTSSNNGANIQQDEIEIEKLEKKCKARHDTLVILEILKQFNLGFDMIDNDCGGAESLLVADELERKTFLLAKKMLFLKMEMNKPNISEKRTFIIYTIISTVADYLANGNIPTEITSIPFEMTISLGQSASLLPHINNHIYKRGPLIKKKSRALGNKFSNKWVVLSHSELLVYSNEKEEQIIIRKPLNEISSIAITPITKEGYNYSFTIYFSNQDNNEITEEWNLSTGSLTSLSSNNQLSTSNSSNNSNCNNGNNSSCNTSPTLIKENSKDNIINNNSNQIKKSNNKQLVFCCESQEDMINWILAIDGVSNSNFKSTMDLVQKEQFLNLNKTNHKGGSFRFGEEEWIYCDGKLTNNCWGEPLEYIWDGCTLIASPDSKIHLGKGRWNGVWLTWYSEKEKIKEPYLKYLYQPQQKQFTFDSFPIRNQFSWTLSRHFLVSSSGQAGGEWIIEGDVPPTLVMLVQMMKYYKAGK